MVRAESPNESNVFTFLDAIAGFIEKSQDQKIIDILGPVQSPVGKIRGKIRGQLMLKSKNRKKLHEMGGRLLSFVDTKRAGTKVKWSIDVDPTDHS